MFDTLIGLLYCRDESDDSVWVLFLGSMSYMFLYSCMC